MYLHCEAVLVLNILLCVTLFFWLFVLILLRPSNIWWKWSNTQQTQKSLRGKFKIHCCYHSSILWIQTVSSSWAPLFIIGFYSDCRIILYPILKVELLMSSQQSELLLLSVMEAVCLSQRDSDMYVQIYWLCNCSIPVPSEEFKCCFTLKCTCTCNFFLTTFKIFIEIFVLLDFMESSCQFSSILVVFRITNQILN